MRYVRMLATLDRRDVVGLADYLSRLEPNKKPDASVRAIAR